MDILSTFIVVGRSYDIKVDKTLVFMSGGKLELPLFHVAEGTTETTNNKQTFVQTRR